MNREAVIWAAGLFEGEGCIVQSRTPRKNGQFHWNLQLKLSMTDFDTVYRFFAAVDGMGQLRWNLRQQQPHHKPQLAWECTRFEHTQAILAAFWPWLGHRRKTKASEALSTWIQQAREGPTPRALRTHCPQGHPYTAENTYVQARAGGRYSRHCKECRNASVRRWYARNRKAAAS